MIDPSFYSLTISRTSMAAMVVAVIAAAWLLIYTMRRLRIIVKKCTDDNNTDPTTEILPPVSVIIYSQAGGDALKQLITEIYTQSYNAPIEVIVVNADSEEWVDDVVKVLRPQYPTLRTTFVPQQSRNLSRQKLAITLGIKAASHDIVVLTLGDCVPTSPLWLASITQHFNYDTDIVAGRTFIRDRDGEDHSGAMRSFDNMLQALRSIPAIISGDPIGVDSGNLAYRKELFFRCKGFSSNLNLNYGHDDIFIAELSRTGTIAAELSSRSIIERRLTSPKQCYDLERTNRRFTSKRLRRLPFALTRASVIATWVWLAACATAIIASLPSLITAGAVVLLAISTWCPICRWWSKAAKHLGIAPHTFSLPFLWLLSPLYALKLNNCAHHHKRNYTWQN